jgi:VWFA-related protein
MMPRAHARSAGLAVVLALVLAGAALRAGRQQTPAPQRTFRSGIDLVTVDVTVLDNAGLPVRGLEAGDFAVELDGQVRPVRVVDWIEFERLDAPIALGPNRPASPPANPTEAPRVVVLVVDDLSMDRQDGKSVQPAGIRFMESLRPNDLLGFATTSGEGALINPTQDREPVRHALQYTFGRATDNAPEDLCPPTLEELQCPCLATALDHIARQQLENYESLALSIGSAPLGRTMVVMTYGVAPTLICRIGGGPPPPDWYRERDLSNIQPFAQALARAGVSAYFLAIEPTPGFGPTLEPDRWFASVRLTADASGAHFDRIIGQADRNFARIRTAMSAFYRLGVELPSERVDPRVRVAVKVGRKDVTVEARRSALVPEGARAARTIDEALESAATRGEYWRDVPVSLSVAVRQSAAADRMQLGLHVAVPPSAAGPLSAVIAVVDEAGAPVWTGRASLVAAEPGADYARSTTVDVPPGSYRVRAAVADINEHLGVADRTVSARLHDLGAFRVSDVFTSWAGADDTYRFTLGRLPAEAELVHAEIEVYGAGPATLLVVKWVMSPADPAQEAIERESDVASEDGVMKAIAELPVADLPPGLYTLRAIVSDPTAQLGIVTAVLSRPAR